MKDNLKEFKEKIVINTRDYIRKKLLMLHWNCKCLIFWDDFFKKRLIIWDRGSTLMLFDFQF